MDDHERRPCRPRFVSRRVPRPGPPRISAAAARRARPFALLGIGDAARASRGARRLRSAR